MYIEKTTLGRFINVFIEAITKFLQWVIQISAILTLVGLSAFGFFKIYLAFLGYSDFYHFLEDILHALEIFFIAPIPILIIFSFRRYIIAMLEGESVNSKSHNDRLDRIFNPAKAKISFVSSLIGVTATVILSKVIAILRGPATGEVSTGAATSSSIIFSLAFLLILVLLYNVFSKSLNH